MQVRQRAFHALPSAKGEGGSRRLKRGSQRYGLCDCGTSLPRLLRRYDGSCSPDIARPAGARQLCLHSIFAAFPACLGVSSAQPRLPARLAYGRAGTTKSRPYERRYPSASGTAALHAGRSLGPLYLSPIRIRMRSKPRSSGALRTFAGSFPPMSGMAVTLVSAASFPSPRWGAGRHF